MKKIHRFYPESSFGGFSDIDGTIIFYSRVNSLLKPSDVVLDVGCGRGEYSEDSIDYRRKLRSLKGKVAKVIGIDVDPRAAENPNIDEFNLIDGDSWAVESDSVDVIVCDYVLEHVSDPRQIFSEFKRVLRDGGYLCVRTTNRWGYVGVIASLIPNRFHAKITGKVQEDRKTEDVFPTVYKCNSTRKIRKQMKASGFDSVVYGYGSEPKYFEFSVIFYWLGKLYERIAPKFLQPAIFAFGILSK